VTRNSMAVARGNQPYRNAATHWPRRSLNALRGALTGISWDWVQMNGPGGFAPRPGAIERPTPSMPLAPPSRPSILLRTPGEGVPWAEGAAELPQGRWRSDLAERHAEIALFWARTLHSAEGARLTDRERRLAHAYIFSVLSLLRDTDGCEALRTQLSREQFPTAHLNAERIRSNAWHV
jgi:hypothetical protein